MSRDDWFVLVFILISQAWGMTFAITRVWWASAWCAAWALAAAVGSLL